ncbi:uncharacterized protein LOC144703636 [Wolffia australiana]
MAIFCRAPSKTGVSSSKRTVMAMFFIRGSANAVEHTVAGIVNVLVGDGEQSREEELRRLLAAPPPPTSSVLLNVIRSLPCPDLALWFYRWCNGQNKALPIHGPSAYHAMFEIVACSSRSCQRLKELLEQSLKEGHALTLDSATVLVNVFTGADMVSEALRVLLLLRPSLRRTGLCNTVLRRIQNSGEAVDLVKMMIGNKVHPRCGPDPATASIVYSALVTRNPTVDDESAAGAVDLARGGLFPPGEAEFCRIIAKFCRSRRAGAAWDFLYAVKRAGGTVTAPVFNSLLSGLARDGDFPRMDELFSEMEQMGIHQNPITVGILVNNLCKSGRLNQALDLLEAMAINNSSSSSCVDVVVFNTVIDGLCKAGRTLEGVAMARKMKEELGLAPTTITYNCLIHGFCMGGEIEQAMELMEEMKSEGVPPSVVTLNMLIDGLCRGGRASSALDLLRRVQCHDNAQVKENAATYSVLIGAFLHGGNITKAEKLLQEMLAKDVRPDAKTYYTLVSGLVQAGKPEEASSVVAAMVEDGFKLDAKGYNMLIAGYCERRKLDKAEDLVQEMTCKGVQPDVVTFNTLIAGLSRAADFAGARRLMEKMAESRLKPSAVTYGGLIHGLCRAGDIQAALGVVQEMEAAGVVPNAVVFNMLIDFWSKRREPEKAVELMAEMQHRGLKPMIVVYNAVLRSFKEKNMLKEALDLMQRMDEQKLVPDYVTIEILSGWLPAVGEAARLRSFLARVDSLS